eukprot:6193987-Pleurochrysis_carterae.AAC.2
MYTLRPYCFLCGSSPRAKSQIKCPPYRIHVALEKLICPIVCAEKVKVVRRTSLTVCRVMCSHLLFCREKRCHVERYRRVPTYSSKSNEGLDLTLVTQSEEKKSVQVISSSVDGTTVSSFIHVEFCASASLRECHFPCKTVDSPLTEPSQASFN